MAVTASWGGKIPNWGGVPVATGEAVGGTTPISLLRDITGSSQSGPQTFDVIGSDGRVRRYTMAQGYTAADAQKQADTAAADVKAGRKPPPDVAGQDLGPAPAGKTRTNPDGSAWTWNGKSWDETKGPTNAAPDASKLPPPAPLQNSPNGGVTKSNSDGSSWVWNGKSWDFQAADPNRPFAPQPLPVNPNDRFVGTPSGSPTSSSALAQAIAATPPSSQGNLKMLTAGSGFPSSPGVTSIGAGAATITPAQEAQNAVIARARMQAAQAAQAQADAEAAANANRVVAGNGTDLATAINNSQNLQNQFNQPATRYTAPVASASLIGPVAQADMQAAIQAGVATAGQSQAGHIDSTAMAQQQAAIQAERVQAALVQRQNDIQAQQVTAAQAGRTVVGPTALSGSTNLAPTALSGQTTIDTTPQAEFRQGQEGLVAGLQGAIAGTDPSVAAIMLRQATERNQANQFAMAQAASGGNVGFAQRQAMMNAADINQQSIGQQALLRAQEIATARGQLGGALDQARGTDVGLATSQGGLAQQVNLANAGFTNTANMTQAQLDQAIKLANAGFKNTATTTQAQLDQATAALNTQQANQVGLANANNALEAAKTNVTLAQAAALANQSAENTAALQNAQNALAAATKNAELAQAVALSNQSALNNTSQVNAQLANATGIANAGNVTQASVTNANNQTSAATSNKQFDTQTALANALAQNNANTTNANNATTVSRENANNAVQTNSQNITSTQNSAANTLNASNQGTTAANDKAIADQKQRDAAALKDYQDLQLKIQAASGLASGLTSGGDKSILNQALNKLNGGSTGAPTTTGTPTTDANGNPVPDSSPGSGTSAPGVTVDLNTGTPSGPGTQTTGQPDDNSGDPNSDRRVKKNIRRADAEISALLGSIKPYGFKYKNPNAPGNAPGKRFGVMAQDLEKSNAGKSLVNNTPRGKTVDTNQAVLAALASLGNVDKRLKKIEKRAA
jgi:Chaperone of endosialidase